MERTTVIVPAAFYEDHASRGCVEYSPDAVLARKGKRLTVSLDDRDLLDLFSDARHYASSGVSVYGREMIGLIASARATVAALNEQVPDITFRLLVLDEAVRQQIKATKGN